MKRKKILGLLLIFIPLVWLLLFPNGEGDLTKYNTFILEVSEFLQLSIRFVTIILSKWIMIIVLTTGMYLLFYE